METNMFVELFEKVGLTATMLGAFGWYILKKDKEKAATDQEIRDRQNLERDMLIQTIERNRLTNESLLNTNKELAEANRLMINEFSNKINNIENSVIEIKHELRHKAYAKE